MLEIPDIYFGVNGRCWARAYVFRKNEGTPPLGLKRLVPNYYFAFSYRPLGALVKFPCGEGAQQLQCKSESAQCSEKQQSPCEGDWGLKFEKKMLENNKTHTLEKNGHWLPCILYFFIHPNPIT